jgi:hypothetical protein
MREEGTEEETLKCWRWHWGSMVNEELSLWGERGMGGWVGRGSLPRAADQGRMTFLTLITPRVSSRHLRHRSPNVAPSLGLTAQAIPAPNSRKSLQAAACLEPHTRALCLHILENRSSHNIHVTKASAISNINEDKWISQMLQLAQQLPEPCLAHRGGCSVGVGAVVEMYEKLPIDVCHSPARAGSHRGLRGNLEEILRAHFTLLWTWS